MDSLKKLCISKTIKKGLLFSRPFLFIYQPGFCPSFGFVMISPVGIGYR